MKRVWAMIAVLSLVLVAAGCGKAGSAPGGQPAEKNPQKELALAFYMEMHNGDRGKAWDMFDEVVKKRTPKEAFVRLWGDVKRYEPKEIRIQEKRRPQQEAYTYTFEAKDLDPYFVKVVGNETDGYTVIDYGKLEEGESP